MSQLPLFPKSVNHCSFHWGYHLCKPTKLAALRETDPIHARSQN
jgi:hypothetical protein